MSIQKTVISFTLLHPAGLELEDIDDAIHEAREGDAVGMETDRITTDVPADSVADELRKLGNDGAFFEEV